MSITTHGIAARICSGLWVAFSCATLLVVAAALVACPDEGGKDDDAVDGEVLPGGRTYLLAARAEAYDPAHRPPEVGSLASLTIASATPSRPVEALVIPLDSIGIPWTSFVGEDNVPGELPAAWLKAVDGLVAIATEAGVPVVLSVSPISPRFDTLAPLAKDTGGALVLDDAWQEYCYDPSKDSMPERHRGPFAGFVVWAVERFHPKTIVLGQRLNLYEATCGKSAYDAVLGYVAEARSRVLALAKPPTVAATVDVEDLYGYPDKPGRCQTGTPQACLASRQALVTALLDALGEFGIFGLESYPARAMADLDGIPEDWLRRVADLAPAGRKTAVLGTGLPAIRLETRAGVCTPLLEATEVDQKRWLDQVVAVADLKDMPYVVWRSLVDLADADVVGSCPCAGDFALCEHFAGLGAGGDDRRLQLARGLWTVDGTPRQAASLWLSLLSGGGR